MAAGVRRERLVAAGRGAADPLATPALSRRVEIRACEWEEMSMVGLFAQMWVLELAAFLLGAAVTWLVFVRPARAAAARAAQPVHLPPAWASGGAAGAGPAPPEARAADPHHRPRARGARRPRPARPRAAGSSRADVLEQLTHDVAAARSIPSPGWPFGAGLTRSPPGG